MADSILLDVSMLVSCRHLGNANLQDAWPHMFHESWTPPRNFDSGWHSHHAACMLNQLFVLDLVFARMCSAASTGCQCMPVSDATDLRTRPMCCRHWFKAVCAGA